MSRRGPSVLGGWCLVILHSQDGLHISFMIRPLTDFQRNSPVAAH